MTAQRRRSARAPLPGDAVHLGQVLHDVRVMREEIRGFRIPAHPSPVVVIMAKRNLSDERPKREMEAIKIIRAAHSAAQLVKRGRADRDEQITKLADALDTSPAIATNLLEAYLQI